MKILLDFFYEYIIIKIFITKKSKAFFIGIKGIFCNENDKIIVKKKLNEKNHVVFVSNDQYNKYDLIDSDDDNLHFKKIQWISDCYGSNELILDFLIKKKQPILKKKTISIYQQKKQNIMQKDRLTGKKRNFTKMNGVSKNKPNKIRRIN